ncbi:IclR family transcriptional regulator [Variovorax sp. VNK109]|jgi:DNA-binding IclR family transcriptional regulator|uniref:IclR family transcriptional regulator n=1 Tax=Variovorax sp. VNK109 TaxID=3400919 RepID=UPI003C09A556
MPALKSSTAKPAAKAPKVVRVRPVPAVSRSIAILRFLGEAKQGLGVKAIADQLGLVPSTCLHILRVLVSEDLVKVDPDTKRYVLGSGMISLARSVLEGGGFARLVQPALDRLASNWGVTAMGVEVTPRPTVIVLALSKSNQPFRLHTDVGSQFSGYVSATGRLIAAYSGENWTQMRKKFNATPWDKAPSFDIWKRDVEEARAQGWAVDRDNFMGGLTVVAVPVFDAAGKLTHTLVAAGLSSQLDAATVKDVVKTMREEARAVANLMFATA